MEPHVYPWKVTIDPPQIPPGTNARIKVELNQTTQSDLVVTMASNPAGFFTNLPQTITVPAGADEYVFDVTTCPTCSGACLVTATANGKVAAGGCACESTD